MFACEKRTENVCLTLNIIKREIKLNRNNSQKWLEISIQSILSKYLINFFSVCSLFCD